MPAGTKAELIAFVEREVLDPEREEGQTAATRRASELAKARAEGVVLALQVLREWEVIPEVEASREVGTFYRDPQTRTLEAVVEEGTIAVRNYGDGLSLHGSTSLVLLPEVSNVVEVRLRKREPAPVPEVGTKPEAKPKKRARG